MTSEASRVWIETVRARWWFIPSWWSKPLKELPTTFNARAAELLDKPFFRERLLRGQRCLVHLDSFYEFKGPRGKKEAYRFRQRDGRLLVCPGIWDEWTDRTTGEVVTSFTLLTTEPTDLVREYHNRMALSLHPDNYKPWLDTTINADSGTADGAERFPDRRCARSPLYNTRMGLTIP